MLIIFLCSILLIGISLKVNWRGTDLVKQVLAAANSRTIEKNTPYTH